MELKRNPRAADTQERTADERGRANTRSRKGMMFIQLSAVIVDADAANRAELAQVLAGYGLAVVQQFATIDELTTYLEQADAPQVAMVNLDPAASDMLHAMSRLPRQFTDTAFFAMSQLLDPQLLMRSMSIGVREFIPLPMTEETLHDALERLAQVHGSDRRARVIQCVPTIGGCGSTTVACNVAASLAAAGNKTCLVDLDLVRGGVSSAFDIRPQYTIADVMESADRVDQQLVENALVRHEKSGLFLLARPEMMEETQRVTQSGLQKLIGLLGRMFDYVVLDTTMSVDPIYSTATAATDLSVVVMQLNVPSAKNAERYVATLRRQGVETSKVRVVVNRFVKKGWDIEPREVERALGFEIGWTIPNDYKTALSAINYGEPAVVRAPKSDMSVSLKRFAESLRTPAGSAGASSRRRAA